MKPLFFLSLDYKVKQTKTLSRETLHSSIVLFTIRASNASSLSGAVIGAYMITNALYKMPHVETLVAS